MKETQSCLATQFRRSWSVSQPRSSWAAATTSLPSRPISLRRPPHPTSSRPHRAPTSTPAIFVGVVDNRYLPWRPGTRFVYVGEEDGEPVRDVTDVTHEQKT